MDVGGVGVGVEVGGWGWGGGRLSGFSSRSFATMDWSPASTQHVMMRVAVRETVQIVTKIGTA